VLVIVSVFTGTAWPLVFAVKALLFGLIAFAVIGMLRRRHRGRTRG
jgi:MYXO-CTERM domain-containing protein